MEFKAKGFILLYCLSCAIFAGVQAHFVQDSGRTRLDQVIFCLMFQLQNVITAKAAAHVHKMLRQSRLNCAARLQAQLYICCKDQTMFMPIPGSSLWHAVDPRWMQGKPTSLKKMIIHSQKGIPLKALRYVRPGSERSAHGSDRMQLCRESAGYNQRLKLFKLICPSGEFIQLRAFKVTRGSYWAQRQM